MKRNLTKTIVLLLTAIMLVSCLTGCGGDKTAGGQGFTVTISKPNSKADEAMQPTFERWESLSDVPITWNKLNSESWSESLQLMFASGDYPEVILGNLLQTSDVSKYAANGILVALDQYISKELTPNIYDFFEKNPQSKVACTLPDGHIYSLPRFFNLESLYLESVFFINKKWLDKLNLEVPETMNELVEVLRAFKTGDPNGNGEQDEIPMTFYNNHGYANLEALLGCWGKPTKSGAYDGFITIEDKKVIFSPMTEEWKEMIKFCRDLYSEGLLDKECFTHSYDTHVAKLAAKTSNVGFVWSNSNPMQNADEYIALPPLKVEGYEPVWRLNPGIISIRDLFSVTTACKNVESVMKWIDKFYTADQSLQNWYGNIGKVFTVDESGKFTFNEPDEGQSLGKFTSDNMVLITPGVLYKEDIGTKVETSALWSEGMSLYEMYEPFIDFDQWPRPYYSVDESKRISELRTDLFDLVEQKKAKWIVGSEDIDAGWESYKQSLENMGVSEYIQLSQAAYDRYQGNMSK